jgi:hypothetical protein
MTVIATCHCGGTRIELPHAPTHATECTCTYCSKAGGLWAYFPPDAVRIVSDAHRGEYSARGINQHFFCARCGCTTYGISPDYTEADIGKDTLPEGRKLAVNVRLCDDFDLGALTIDRIDGRNLW